jgi:hypothetical protein
MRAPLAIAWAASQLIGSNVRHARTKERKLARAASGARTSSRQPGVVS